jgi:hypothetical protein
VTGTVGSGDRRGEARGVRRHEVFRAPRSPDDAKPRRGVSSSGFRGVVVRDHSIGQAGTGRHKPTLGTDARTIWASSVDQGHGYPHQAGRLRHKHRLVTWAHHAKLGRPR